MNEIWNYLTSYTIGDNALWRIVCLFLAILIGLVVGKVVRILLERAAVRMKEQQRPFLSVVLEAVAKPFILIAFIFGLRFGLSFLTLNEAVEAWSASIVNVLIVLTVGFVAYRMVDVITYWLERVAESTESHMDGMLVPLVRTSLRITVAVLVVLQVATMLSDKPLTSILAGIGVGGLAIALAAQDTVKNFFGSLVLFADKPFELGDRVLIDGHDGPVEQLGFRSTRIRTLEGHLITIPNGELANKTIQNIGRRPNIRRIMNVTITYDTPPEKVKRAVDILKEILNDHEGMHPDMPPHVYFNDFNDASLNIFAIYWYHPPDWWAFCAFGERVNHELLRRYNEEGIDFAFPTQTLHLAGDPKRPLEVFSKQA